MWELVSSICQDLELFFFFSQTPTTEPVRPNIKHVFVRLLPVVLGKTYRI